jgi:hypothetical protein
VCSRQRRAARPTEPETLRIVLPAPGTARHPGSLRWATLLRGRLNHSQHRHWARPPLRHLRAHRARSGSQTAGLERLVHQRRVDRARCWLGNLLLATLGWGLLGTVLALVLRGPRSRGRRRAGLRAPRGAAGHRRLVRRCPLAARPAAGHPRPGRHRRGHLRLGRAAAGPLRGRGRGRRDHPVHPPRRRHLTAPAWGADHPARPHHQP